MDELPTHEIVSAILTTAGGAQAWIERDGTGNITVRCLGCRMLRRSRWPHALVDLTSHAPECTVRP